MTLYLKIASGLSVVILTSILLGLSPTPKPDTVPGTLGVPLVAQKASCWCWAACMEMVTRYYHRQDSANPIITQCEAVNAYMASIKQPLMSCPEPAPVPEEFDEGYIPFNLKSAYNCQSYVDLGGHYFNGAIPYDTLAAEFAKGRPVLFQWQWVGVTPEKSVDSNNHWLVAEGCQKSAHSSKQWVSVNDPLPVQQGHHRVMLYTEFANYIMSSAQPTKAKMYDHRFIFNAHQSDLYNIYPLGGINK